MSLEEFTEELQGQLGRKGLIRFKVLRERPLTLDEITGDEILTEGDDDFSVGAWVKQFRKTYGLPRGSVVLVQQQGDDWVAVDVEPDDDDDLEKTPPAVTGSRGGNAALASLLTKLDAAGIINDETTV